MHTLLLKLLTACVALMLLSAAPAFANVDRPMQTHPSAGELHAACDANGGTFNESTELGLHTYGCSTSNCDGKGGTCSVNCGDKACTGNTPAILVNANLRMILQNGSRVNHVYLEDDGQDGDTNGDPQPVAPAAPAAPSIL